MKEYKCIICESLPKYEKNELHEEDFTLKVANIIITAGYSIWEDEKKLDFDDPYKIEDPLIFCSIECMEKGRKWIIEKLIIEKSRLE